MRLDSTQDPPGSFLSSFLKGGTRAKCFCGVHRHRSFTSIFYDANFSFPVFAREGKLWLKTEMKLMTALTVMIRSSAWGAYFLLVNRERMFIRTRALIQDRVLFSFLRNSRMCRTKLLFLSKKNREDWKTDLLSLDSSLLERPTKRSLQNFKRDHSFEGTVRSRGQNSWKNVTKSIVFVTRLKVSGLKEDETWLISRYMYSSSAITETE